MKIAVIFDGLQIGGAERVGIDYVKILKELGHDITVINLVPKLNEFECELPDNVELLHIPFPRKLVPEQYAQLIKNGFVGKCVYLIASIVLSVVDGLYKILSKTQKGLREKYDLSIAFSGHFNDLTFVASNFINASKKACWLHGGIYGYAIISHGYLNLYKKIKNLVVLSDEHEIEVFRGNKQMAVKTYKLYNPSYISTRILDQNKIKELKKKYGNYLIMVGRMADDKDQLTIIKALQYIQDKYNFSEKLVFVGAGPNKSKLEQYVKEHSLEDTIFFVGSQMDVQNYYVAAKLFVHSSPAEGLPTTIIEALYFGLPIVATTSLPGVREILQDGKYGIQTDVGDCQQLGEEIYRIYKDQELYERYSSIGKLRAKDFLPETIKRQLKIVLDDIING